MGHHFNHDEVNIIEQCEVAPPQGSLPPIIDLPLTFFDIPWFYSNPVQQIFFYEFPYSTKHILEQALPTLKHSLSLTLQNFFPFASNLILPPHPHVPFIRYQHGDSLSFTVAESQADFTLLASDAPQHVTNWHPFVPSLPQPDALEDGTRVIPLMAIQLTVLPDAGFAICLTFNHVVGDGKSVHHFFKFWATLCNEIITKGATDTNFGSLIENSFLSLPCHDRDIVKDPKGLKHIYLEGLRGQASKRMESQQGIVRDAPTNKVRATLVLTRDQIEKLKKWVLLKYTSSNNHGSETLTHMSTFVVTCSLIWVCMMQSEEKGKGNHNNNDCVTKDSYDDEFCHFAFVADCRGHPDFSIPSTYFGNCLSNGCVSLKRGEVVGENGIAEVASAMEKEVRDLRRDALKRAENLIEKYREFGKPGICMVTVAGSPRLAFYETDFGWGKPKKSEFVHIDSSESISLYDCKDKEGAIEVGLALESTRMNTLINIFEKHLKNIDYSLSLNHSHKAHT